MGRKRKTNKEGERGKTDRGREREEEREKEKGDFPSFSTIETRQFKKKSQSMHSRLRVGTKILEFRQTTRGREFSYLDYFLAKRPFNCMGVFWGRNWPRDLVPRFWD